MQEGMSDVGARAAVFACVSRSEKIAGAVVTIDLKLNSCSQDGGGVAVGWQEGWMLALTSGHVVQDSRDCDGEGNLADVQTGSRQFRASGRERRTHT